MKRDHDAEDWKIDTFEEDDEQPSALASRFFNIAKRTLGYTHTEAGLRMLWQLDEEIHDINKMNDEREQKRDDLSWLIDG